MTIPPFARTAMLPIAMVVGVLFYPFFGRDELAPVAPLLIFGMLFITCCSTSMKKVRVERLHVIVFAVQLFGGVLMYLVFRPVNEILAQGMFISVFAPVAVAAVTIGAILGANVTRMATACIVSNIGVAIVAPLVFSVLNPAAEISFGLSVWLILRKVGPMIVLPMVAALTLELLLPSWHRAVGRRGDLSFYLWSASLTIVMGRTVNFIITHQGALWLEIALGIGSLATCLVQFWVGWYFGRRAGDRTAGGQSLGQKNNVLAIWMAQTYLNPLCSIAPAGYVIWQNIINSYQMSKIRVKS